MTPDIKKTATMQPCCLAVSTNVTLGAVNQPHTATRRWRALCLDNQTELVAGELVTNCDDPLAVIRDKAAAQARARGLEPQRFMLES